ncbi:MAG: ATP/GTP-binding protein [Pseudomonadota bacterium]
MRLHHMILGLGLALVVGIINTARAEPVWQAGVFDMPESAVVDATRDRIILSTIVGHPGTADGAGNLVLLSLDGEVLDPQWVSGLNAPKGMAIMGDSLLVTDLTHLHVVDLATGDITQSITAPDAMFLNDVTADGSTAFISDMMTHAIWRYTDGQLTLWMQDEALSHPNGLLLDGDRLLVGSWGQGMQDDFTTTVPGSLLSIDLASQAITVVVPELGNLDGITQIGDVLLVNDWVNGHLYRVSATGEVRLIAEHPAGLADISSEGDMLFLPLMLDGQLIAEFYPG